MDTNIIIDSQGAVEVNDATIIKKYDDVALIQIDCKTKYAVVHGGGYNGRIYLFATEESKVADGMDRDEPTAIHLSDFTSWELFSVANSRYTISLTFIKN